MQRREFLFALGALAVPFSSLRGYYENSDLPGKYIGVRSNTSRHDGKRPVFYGECFAKDDRLYVRTRDGVFGPVLTGDDVLF